MQSKFEKMSLRAHSNIEVDDYVERFQNWNPWINFFTAVVAIAFALFAWFSLVSLNKWLALRDAHPEMVLLPQSATWYFFPAAGGFILGFELTIQILALFVGREVANLYCGWIAEQPKSYKGGEIYFDTRKVFRWFAVFVVLPIGIITFLNLPKHAALGPESIHDCRFGFSGCEVYPYSKAVRMTATRGFGSGGKFSHPAEIALDFDDGGRWSSARYGDFKDDPDPAIIELLTRKTHLAIENGGK
jgi:hypothetical protein